MVINAMCGGTLTEMCGGTLTEMWGGKLLEVWQHFSGLIGKITKPGQIVTDNRPKVEDKTAKVWP